MPVHETFSRLPGQWERQTHQYSCGENYRIGKVIVGSAFYKSGPRDEPAKYALCINLPGIKSPEQLYTNIEDAKARLERVVATWFRWINERPTAAP
ncbi:hypothetical protein IB276_26110 [Ensifer sp. ENS04]|uniref:hypothetical protein n=1 Tax=Ensifer sp. ENS04 TaxID=2769281 RepID=UPI00177FA8CE|nr:hypothetical protein [Ensifer sp. ENS04]MBD9542925.1 hypothetical protein [Ensifer sp. ENS04]